MKKFFAVLLMLLMAFASINAYANEKASCHVITISSNNNLLSIEECAISVNGRILTCIYMSDSAPRGGGPSCNWEEYNKSKESSIKPAVNKTPTKPSKK